MSIKSAFEYTFNLKARSMEIEKRDASTLQAIKAAPSNYFRNRSLPEDMVVEGFEFVLSKESLGSFGVPKRGDRLIDSELGVNTLVEIEPMYDLKGVILGYRVRTG